MDFIAWDITDICAALVSASHCVVYFYTKRESLEEMPGFSWYSRTLAPKSGHMGQHPV